MRRRRHRADLLRSDERLLRFSDGNTRGDVLLIGLGAERCEADVLIPERVRDSSRGSDAEG